MNAEILLKVSFIFIHFSLTFFISFVKVALSGFPLGVVTLGMYTTDAENVPTYRVDMRKQKSRTNGRKTINKNRWFEEKQKTKSVSCSIFSNPGLLCLFCLCVHVPQQLLTDLCQKYTYVFQFTLP